MSGWLRRIQGPAVVIAGSLLFSVGESSAEDARWERRLADDLTYRGEILGYGFARGLTTDSLLNRGNLLGISSRQASGELRLDLEYRHQDLLLAIKPRLNVTDQSWDYGPQDGQSDTATDLYVQEWIARYRVTDQLFASYGREDLQWGPSYLISPSNPFIVDNGENNPFLEVPGLDYARLSAVVSDSLTGQLIANVGKGELDPISPFKNVYAGKVDLVGTGRYGSVILSQRNDGPLTLGGYAGWTLSDALLAHLEGNITEDGDGQLLAGGSYTFSDGSSLVLEYYYNGMACNKNEIANCFLPVGDTEPGQLLFRRNYGFAQYADTEFLTARTGFILRSTLGLDDGSALLTAIIDYEVNDFTEVFTVIDWFTGADNDEFGSVLKSSVMAGLRFSY